MELNLLLIATTWALGPGVAAPAPTPATQGESKVLVEMFVSHNCAACPYGESILEEVKDIERLAYHVTMWDSEIWEDPFAKPEFQRLQETYSGRYAQGRQFTPQAVINGRVSVEGNRFAPFDAAITKHKKQKSPVLLALSKRGKAASVTVNAVRPLDMKAPRLMGAWTSSNQVVKVKRGRRNYEELTNDNTVERVEKLCDLPLAKGATTCEVTLRGRPSRADRLVVFVQDAKTLNVAGATSMAID